MKSQSILQPTNPLPDTDELAVLDGPSDVDFKLGFERHGKVTLVDTAAIGPVSMSIGYLAAKWPGTYTAAA